MESGGDLTLVRKIQASGTIETRAYSTTTVPAIRRARGDGSTLSARGSRSGS